LFERIICKLILLSATEVDAWREIARQWRRLALRFWLKKTLIELAVTKDTTKVFIVKTKAKNAGLDLEICGEKYFLRPGEEIIVKR